jgi:uncharacterized Ntn-hydrolase superfamily protein
MAMPVRMFLAGVALSLAGSASATWSILLVDLSTGEIALGSATCLTGFDLQANTPVLIPGVGAATAQSFVDSNGFNRSLIRDRLLQGTEPEAILAELAVFDTGHQTRQYGIIDTSGNASTFTGTGAGQWAGGLTGVLPGAGATGGDVYYAIQGNVLTGGVVVDGALEAIGLEPGDLPAKLLAGMKAARDLGGDGRCSCSPNAPTACGPTPPVFTKSSDIAYMLVARAGDREGCSTVHRLGSRPSDVEPLGADRLVVCFSTSDDLAVLTLDPIASPPVLSGVTRFTPGPALRELAAADLTGDGLPDIVGCSGDDAGVWLIPADPAAPAGFGSAEMIFPSGHDVLAGDLDGDGRADIAVADRANDRVVVLWNDPFGLTAGEDIPAGDAPDDLAVFDATGDGLPDLAVVASGDLTARLLTQEPGRVFTPGPAATLTIPAPTRIEMADPDLDGAAELLVAGLTSPTIAVIDASTGAAEGSVTVPSNARDLIALDADLGGVLVLGLAGSAIIRPAFPGGPLISGPSITVSGAPTRAACSDLDADGDRDLAVGAFNGQSVRFIDVEGDELGLTIGCGNGEFYLEFNVAFAVRSDPDPVDQLEGLFAAWASELVGVPDAVRSSVETAGAPLARDGCASELIVTLRDRDGMPASADTLAVEHAPGSAGALTLGEPLELEPGRYAVPLTGTGSRGLDVLRLTAERGGRSVVLMPPALITVDDPADLDADGDADADDLQAWIDAYSAADPAADQNGDGSVTPADFSAWIANANTCR